MVRLKALLSVLFFILSCCAVVAQQFPTKLFDVPDGARPHDVAPAPNGLIWYTAQRQGALGILDPKTGETRHIPLGEKSAPHGVIQGPDGAAWITDGGQNAIVRYDPETDKVNVEVPAPSNGVLGTIDVKEGETVNVGSLLGTINESNIKHIVRSDVR